ncbi:hypothetical protein [Nocardiopsis chromatogenes]|uniref:hypothetical protein n=1 Tax=Nocardiopsis chromatogenes TaxID=280239 RepID=UPI0003484B02|nr:hypothetical protein [Nocardiopsis chromatogenes]
MATDRPATTFADDPLLAAATAPWRIAAPGDRDLNAVFERVGRCLGPWPRSSEILFRITGGDREDRWAVHCGPEGSRSYDAARTDVAADLELIVDATTWWEIACGGLSPLDAFGRGRMRVIGSLTLGRHLAERLGGAASGEDLTSPDERS